MSEQVKVKPTPIQRNPHDVAMELVDVYIKGQYSTNKPLEVDDLRDLYLKFYAVARMAESIHFKYLSEYLPEDLKEIASKF